MCSDISENEIHWCEYLGKQVDDGICTDIQLVSAGYVKPEALTEVSVDKEKTLPICEKCRYTL